MSKRLDMKTLDKKLGLGNWKELSRALNVHSSHVGRILKGTRDPSWRIANLICSIHEISLDDLERYRHEQRTRGVEGRLGF